MNTSASPTNSAPRSKKNIARPPNVRAKQSAACINLRSVAAASAAPSVKIEMRTNAAGIMPESGRHQAGKGHRQRKFPGEMHDLIDPGPGQLAADPDVDEDQSR